MAKINIKNIENVEGKYHVMFIKGKEVFEQANNDIRYAWFSLLLFLSLILLFVFLSGFNLFYVGFLFVFLIFFLFTYFYLRRQRKKAKKQCIHAVQNSKTTDIIAKQVDARKVGRVLVDSVSNDIDKYDRKNDGDNLKQKWIKKRKSDHLVELINEFEEVNVKKKD